LGASLDEEGGDGSQGHTQEMPPISVPENEHDQELAVLPANFVIELRNTAWLPVKQNPPNSLIPWSPPPGVPPVLSPKMSRPQEDIWMCSFCMGIVDTDIANPLLRRLLGWQDDIDPAIVTEQLLLLSETFLKGAGSNFRSTLARVLQE